MHAVGEHADCGSQDSRTAHAHARQPVQQPELSACTYSYPQVQVCCDRVMTADGCLGDLLLTHC